MANIHKALLLNTEYNDCVEKGTCAKLCIMNWLLYFMGHHLYLKDWWIGTLWLPRVGYLQAFSWKWVTLVTSRKRTEWVFGQWQANNIFSNAQKILDIRKLEFWKCCLQLVSWTVFNLKGISHEISSDFFYTIIFICHHLEDVHTIVTTSWHYKIIHE